MLKKLLLSLTVTCLATTAMAHVSLENKSASVGASYKAVFRVPHGCEGQATHTLRVQIPEGVIAVKPMPKAGWSLEKVQKSYNKTYEYHGAQLSEGTGEVIWSGGNLGDDEYDEFVIRVYFPDDFADGAQLHFPVTQQCTNGKTAAWTQIPSEGQDGHDLEHPAPAVTLKKEHSHNHHHNHGHKHNHKHGH